MRLRRKIGYGILAALLALCIYPAYLVFWAERTAAKHGCEFSMKMHKDGCFVDGVNIASDLFAAYSFAGVVIVTMPIGFVIVLTLLVMVGRDLRPRQKDAA